MADKRIYKAQVDSVYLLDNGNLQIVESGDESAGQIEVTKTDAAALIRILQEFVDGEYDTQEGEA